MNNYTTDLYETKREIVNVNFNIDIRITINF